MHQHMAAPILNTGGPSSSQVVTPYLTVLYLILETTNYYHQQFKPKGFLLMHSNNCKHKVSTASNSNPAQKLFHSIGLGGVIGEDLKDPNSIQKHRNSLPGWVGCSPNNNHAPYPYSLAQKRSRR